MWPWNKWADNAVFNEMHYGRYPPLQLLTIADLFAKRRPEILLVDPTTFRKVQRQDLSRNRQGNLL